MEYIDNLHFSEEDLEYLNSLNLFDNDFWIYCGNFALLVKCMQFLREQ